MEYEILMFAVRWLPYDGGPLDETLIEFGLTADRFLERVLELIDRHRPRIHPETASRLTNMCHRRLQDCAGDA
ncbi:hypothetical protein ACQI4L_19280 [Mycolicibacterium litorale]|uniref:hypothetical protein n=1 Tax=Mycolicibacterium litorale TaxID=758802 RepID=UPI003CFB0DA7